MLYMFDVLVWELFWLLMVGVGFVIVCYDGYCDVDYLYVLMCD